MDVEFGAIEKAAKGLPDAFVDGEVVALDSHGSPDFAALQATLSECTTQGLVFFAFDMLFDGAADLLEQPLLRRKERLKTYLNDHADGIILRYVEHFETGGDTVLKSACKLSLEGIVSKSVAAPYVSGRSDTWTKAKCRAGHEGRDRGMVHHGWKIQIVLVGVNRGRPFRLCWPCRDRLQPNFAKDLKALRWRTPCQAICDAWISDPSAFRIISSRDRTPSIDNLPLHQRSSVPPSFQSTHNNAGLKDAPLRPNSDHQPSASFNTAR